MEMFRRVEYPGLPRPAPIARVPVWLSETPGALRRRPPTLGEHTQQILAELGYDEASVAELRRTGVV
jgi:crotonobetainyl-CoA:carnitine CoA-transferase CaiB-like acyl-CoA transferase